MNLFRSEEHVRQWAKFDPASEAGIKPYAGIAKLFSFPMFREWLAPDYLLRMGQLARDFQAGIAALGDEWSFWNTQPPR